METGLIGVTGATGHVGGGVARRLARRGVAQRLIVRDPARAPQLAGAEIRQAAGYGAGDEMRRALEGVTSLFLVSGREAPDRVEQHITAIDAAVAAGVPRIVYLSFLGASPTAAFTLARQHWATEQHILHCGVQSFTFLRMNLYLDFIPSMVPSDGVIAGPAGDGRVAAVTRGDVCDVATAVLTGRGHDGQTYDLTGRESITLTEAAAEMSRLSGKRIRFRNETLEEAYASRAVYGAPDWEVEGWVSTYQAIAAGELNVVTDAVSRLAGHDPAALREYMRTHPQSLAHVTSG